LVQTTLYADVFAKMGAQRSQFISEGKLRTLMDARDIDEFTSQLRETSYQQQIAKITSPINARKLERAFTENLIETYIKIIKNSPKKPASLLRMYLLRLEVENIKALIKASNANLNFEQKISKLYLSAETFLKRNVIVEEATAAPDLRQTVNALKKTPYGSALNMGMTSYEEDGSTACFDVLLDRYFYEKLYETYQHLPRKEKPHARFYVSLEIDGFVLLMLLRGKNLNYDSNWLRLAMPTKPFSMSDKMVEELVMASDFDSAHKIILESPYAKFFVKAQTSEETVSNAQKTLRKALFTHAKEGRFKEFFNVGEVIAFLLQKENEVHNLIAASLGVEAGLNPEVIEGNLLF
jgi:vacuolar-type H+-ATPase subunit C/Vma6